MLVERRASDRREIELNGRRARPYIGGVLGGSTSLYGAAFLRPGPSDFQPGRHYGDRIPTAIHEWPFDLAELEPFLDIAEDLYEVAGPRNPEFPHIGNRSRPYPRPSPPLVDVNRHVSERLARAGARPFSLPLAIDFRTCSRCPTCPGYLCPNGARRTSENATIEPAIRTGRVTVWTNAEVHRLEREGTRIGRVVGIRCGERFEVRATDVLVAAGAIGTPVLLQRSNIGSRSGELGGNHMCHLGAVAGAVFARSLGASSRFLKQLALTDHYLGTPDFPHKLGYAQFVPVPGIETLRSHAPVPMPRALARFPARPHDPVRRLGRGSPLAGEPCGAARTERHPSPPEVRGLRRPSREALRAGTPRPRS